MPKPFTAPSSLFLWDRLVRGNLSGRRFAGRALIWHVVVRIGAGYIAVCRLLDARCIAVSRCVACGKAIFNSLVD